MKLKYSDWKSITINVYDKLQKKIKEVELGDDKNINALNQNIAILSVLCDVDEDTIASLSLDEFTALATQTNFLKDIPKVKIENKYKINGNDYEVWLDIQNMNMAQYIDFQTFYKKPDENLKQIIACFLLPKGKKYGDGYDIVKVVNEIGEHLSIVDARSIMFFFVLAFQSLTKVTLSCLEKQMKREMKREKDREKVNKMKMAITQIQRAASLVENGDGFLL